MAEQYKELMDGWELTYDRNGPAGTRVFQRNDVAGSITLANLPIVVGSSTMTTKSGSAITGCVCQGYKWRFTGGVAQVTATYGLGDGRKGAPAPPGDAISTDPNMDQWSAAGDVFSIPDGGAEWTWSSTPLVAVEQPLFIAVPSGEIRLPKTVLAANFSAFKSAVAALVGKTNGATFEGYAVGQVLFEGAQGGARYNAAGVLEYGFDLIFKWRKVGGSVESDDWNYIWREDGTGKWDTPIDSSFGTLYDEGNFTTVDKDWTVP